jgi:DNA-binding NarL/FixJ family response regulator
MPATRILVVDDLEAWRQRVRSILETLPDLHVVGEASDGKEAVQKAEELKPDLILLDIGLPNLNGIEAELQIYKLVPSAKVIFLSQNDDQEIVNTVVGDGAFGYVLKSDAGSELLPAIKTILGGEKFVSSGIRVARPERREQIQR